MEIRHNISTACRGLLKIWLDANRIQQYFVSKQAESLEQEIDVHVKVTTKTYGTDCEMPCISGIGGCQKRRRWMTSCIYVCVCVCVCGVGMCMCMFVCMCDVYVCVYVWYVCVFVVSLPALQVRILVCLVGLAVYLYDTHEAEPLGRN